MMEKRGQFYLIAAIIIIAILLGLTFIFNYSDVASKGVQNFYIKEELSIESEKVMDYALKNNLDSRLLLENFTRVYSNYSNADEFYFLFGNENTTTVSGLIKSSSGNILANMGGGDQQLSFNENQYSSRNFTNVSNQVTLTINDLVYNFTINKGENFYFVVSKHIGDERYIFTTQDSEISGIVIENSPLNESNNSQSNDSGLVISSNTTNYNLFEVLGSPTQPVDVNLTINAGVVIGSTSTSTPSLTTGNLPNGSTIRIINNGFILGKGGNGGNYPGGKTSGLSGNGGGTALEITVQTSIKNNGIIGGGGGGGGAGGGSSCSQCYDDPGAGGGGGAGYNSGSGGTSPRTGSFTGSSGNLLNGGTGGTVSYQGSAEYARSGDGGSGGNLGSSGGNGENGQPYSGGSGGQGGNAVTGNSFVTWTLQGDVRGALQ